MCTGEINYNRMKMWNLVIRIVLFKLWKYWEKNGLQTFIWILKFNCLLYAHASFPNTLLAWTFTGNEFCLTCSMNNVNIIVLLWGVRTNCIDSHFSLSSSHTTLTYWQRIFYLPALQTQARTWHSNWVLSDTYSYCIQERHTFRWHLCSVTVCKVRKRAIYFVSNLS